MKTESSSRGMWEFPIYPKRDVELVKGQNAQVMDSNGKTYIDCVAGHGTGNIGHSNPFVVEAVKRQAEKLIICSGIFYNDVRERFLEKLFNVTPAGLDRAFLCNSGAEAVESALKFARYTTGKTEFVSAMNGFHGRTYGAMTVTYNPLYRKEFEPNLPGCRYVPFNNIEKLEGAVGANTAAVILEVVQGEGGVRVGKPEYFQAARELCDRHGALLIIDEVQTGFCRTGRWFACEHMGVVPDMMTLAKAIAGGLPLGAVLVNSQKVQPPTGKHGSTFGGNPLSCAAGLAAIEFMEREDLNRQAREKGAFFRELFADFRSPVVREFRQLGLMIGIELKVKVKPVLERLIEKGVLALPAGPTVLRLLPPLTISEAELQYVAEQVKRTLQEIEAEALPRQTVEAANKPTGSK